MSKAVAKTIEMTKRQFNAWYNGLRSGKYKQAKGCLIDYSGAMCCLGVLEYVLEGKVEKDNGFPSTDFMLRNNITFFDNNGLSTFDEDLEEHSPYLTGGYANVLNDDKKLSFKQIAQRLKSRVKFIPEKKTAKKVVKKVVKKKKS